MGEAGILILLGRLDEAGQVSDGQFREIFALFQVGELKGDLLQFGVAVQFDGLEVGQVTYVGIEQIAQVIGREVEVF